MVLMDIARLKGYLFDLDGTLLASTRFWHEAYGKALARFGVEMPADYVEHVNHLNIASGTAYTAERIRHRGRRRKRGKSVAGTGGRRLCGRDRTHATRKRAALCAEKCR